MSVQSDLDLHCPQKPLVSSTVRKELTKSKSFIYLHTVAPTIIPTIIPTFDAELAASGSAETGNNKALILL